MEAISKISMTQKNSPIATVAPSSACFFSSLVTGVGMGGINANIRKEKNMLTKNKGTHTIPHPTGPNGVIHNCPAHVARKIIRKNTHKPRIGLLENIEKINTTNKVTRNAAGIM